MINRALIIGACGLGLILTGCASEATKAQLTPGPTYTCQNLKREIHAGLNQYQSPAHNRGQVTAISKAQLMKDYERYGCDQES